MINILIVKAQSPITVTVTGTCNQVSGEFIYDGTLNGKNHYTREYTDGTGTFYFHVSFDNTQWVLYVDDSINEMAFYNTIVPEGMLPPNTDWIPDICSDGTMFIEGGVNIGINDLPQSSNISINVYNDNILKIEFSETLTTEVEINIFNIFGQKLFLEKIKSRSSVYELDLNMFSTGIYIVNILNKKKRILIN